MAKTGIPQGTRDFSAAIIHKRQFILDTIKSVFELYGFQPLETPAMENLETLMGKYGEEGDKLLFKILNNGLNDPKNIDKAKSGFSKLMEGKTSAELTERALRYDLTIPFARHVAMNHGLLTFPYKRYQMQPVWRADRPQKGRYREFTQCDADVVGSNSLLNECELALIYHRVFVKLGLKDYSLRINNRKILAALARLCGAGEKMTEITVAIDKLDKIGIEKVTDELRLRGLSDSSIELIKKFLSLEGDSNTKLNALRTMFNNDEEGKKGVEELSFVLNNTQGINMEVDLTLARGLNYYTGTIFEVKAPENIKMGSIGGGGRYDDLTGLFGVPGVPGVGISFGVDRIFDVMQELSLFPADINQATKVLFFNLGEKEAAMAFNTAEKLRSNGISCELYHENVKLDKQFRYAEKKGIPFIVILGSRELANGTAVIKQLSTGDQKEVKLTEIIPYFQQH
jgi:histidyl-tRNA synthetase